MRQPIGADDPRRSPDQLVDAWLDYKQAVGAVNRDRWGKDSVAREEQRAAREAREKAIREQMGVADLLDEDGL